MDFTLFYSWLLLNTASNLFGSGIDKVQLAVQKGEMHWSAEQNSQSAKRIMESAPSGKEVSARPKAGFKNFYDYLERHYQVPRAARKDGVKGELLVFFHVNADGSLSNFQVMKDLGKGTGEELIRVIKSGPRWIAGKDSEGNFVTTSFSIPLRIGVDFTSSF